MKIGILGGTFDPPHNGHLNLARSALASGEVDKLLLIPAATPPHKSRDDMLCADIRLEMTRQLALDLPAAEVCDIELQLEGVSFTYNTVLALRAKYPLDTFRLIIGADMALIFDSWRNASELIEIARPLIAARPGFAFPPGFGTTLPLGLDPAEREILKQSIFELDEIELSSTELRSKIAAGDDARNFIPPKVYDYILANQLYLP